MRHKKCLRKVCVIMKQFWPRALTKNINELTSAKCCVFLSFFIIIAAMIHLLWATELSFGFPNCNKIVSDTFSVKKIVERGFLSPYMSETPLQWKLINRTIASIVYDKVVIIAIFLETVPMDHTTVRGTQRDFSSKPLKHSIVKRIWVFKRHIFIP